MTRSRLVGLLLLCWFALAGIATAQEPKPTVTAVLSSEKALLDNIHYLMVDLGGAKDEYISLKDMIELLLLGVDKNAPISFRSYVVGKELRDLLTLSIPTDKAFREFVGNLNDLGYDLRKDPSATRNEELWRMNKLDLGSVRYDAKAKTVLIAPLGMNRNAQAGARSLVRTVVSKPAAELLNGRDLVVIIENTADKLADRKAAFATLTANITKTIETKDAKLSPAEHALAVAVSKHQMAEFERFFAEAAKLVIGSKTSKEKGTSALDIELVPLPKTSLAESVDLLGKTPDEFAAVSDENTVVTLNVNMPIDALRKEHVMAAAKLWLPVLKERIDNRKDTSADQKQIEKDLSEMITTAVTDVAEMGNVNAFARVYQKDKEYTTVGGSKVPNGKKFLDHLEKMNGKKGTVVKLDIDKVSEAALGAGTTSTVAIHSVSTPDAAKDFPEFFGEDGLVFVGTSDTTIWYAYGEGALETLKKSIHDCLAAGPKPSPLLVNARLSLLQYVKAWDRRQGKTGEVAVRKAAIEGLSAGKDVVTLKLWRDEKDPNLIRVHAQAEEGALRAAGKVSAKVVKDKLE